MTITASSSSLSTTSTAPAVAFTTSAAPAVSFTTSTAPAVSLSTSNAPAVSFWATCATKVRDAVFPRPSFHPVIPHKSVSATNLSGFWDGSLQRPPSLQRSVLFTPDSYKYQSPSQLFRDSMASLPLIDSMTSIPDALGGGMSAEAQAEAANVDYYPVASHFSPVSNPLIPDESQYRDMGILPMKTQRQVLSSQIPSPSGVQNPQGHAEMLCSLTTFERCFGDPFAVRRVGPYDRVVSSRGNYPCLHKGPDLEERPMSSGASSRESDSPAQRAEGAADPLSAVPRSILQYNTHYRRKASDCLDSARTRSGPLVSSTRGEETRGDCSSVVSSRVSDSSLKREGICASQRAPHPPGTQYGKLRSYLRTTRVEGTLGIRSPATSALCSSAVVLTPEAQDGDEGSYGAPLQREDRKGSLGEISGLPSPSGSPTPSHDNDGSPQIKQQGAGFSTETAGAGNKT